MPTQYKLCVLDTVHKDAQALSRITDAALHYTMICQWLQLFVIGCPVHILMLADQRVLILKHRAWHESMIRASWHGVSDVLQHRAKPFPVFLVSLETSIYGLLGGYADDAQGLFKRSRTCKST